MRHTISSVFKDPYTMSHTTSNGFNIKTFGTSGIGSSPYDVNTPLSFMDDEQVEDFHLNNIEDNNPHKNKMISIVMKNREYIKQKQREIEALRASSLRVLQDTGVNPELLEKKNKIKLKLGKNE